MSEPTRTVFPEALETVASVLPPKERLLSSRRSRIVLIMAIVVVLAAAAVPLSLYLLHRQERDRLLAAEQAFPRAWLSNSFTDIRFDGSDATTVAGRFKEITAGLTAQKIDAPAAIEVTRLGEPANGSAVETLAVHWDLGQGRSWSYATRVTFRQRDGQWDVVWQPSIVHPQLTAGLVLTASRTPATRGQILGSAGQILVSERPVVFVGLQPSRTHDRRASAIAVADAVGVDAAQLTARVLAAPPQSFVDVITLRRPQYDAIRGELQPIPGIVFKEGTLSLPPTTGFARALLGSVGPATKEIIAASKGRLQVGDTTGLAGIQRTYNEQLSGTPGVIVTADPAAGTPPVDGAESPSRPTLYDVPATPGKSVTLTLDQRIQEAAEAALSKATKPAGLVAIRPSTGEVLAVANGGPNAAGYNRALLGQYPPGSTFKVATAFALLQAGITPQSPVPCPPSVTVNGRTFHNAEQEVLNTVPFIIDFAKSCNTAFVGSHDKITGAELKSAANSLGYGAVNALGVAAFTGTVPQTEAPVEHAADMIGQGRVLASPLTVATVAASVAAGHHVQVRLVTDPAPTEQGVAGDPLPSSAVAALQTMMRAVVTSGTGSALGSVAGAPVFGKTGTAEFGAKTPPQTHGWFTGYQGDLAFAVVVEDGGFGATSAAPLVADFLGRAQ